LTPQLASISLPQLAPSNARRAGELRRAISFAWKRLRSSGHRFFYLCVQLGQSGKDDVGPFCLRSWAMKPTPARPRFIHHDQAEESGIPAVHLIRKNGLLRNRKWSAIDGYRFPAGTTATNVRFFGSRNLLRRNNGSLKKEIKGKIVSPLHVGETPYDANVRSDFAAREGCSS
jgi:hypothetical protein